MRNMAFKFDQYCRIWAAWKCQNVHRIYKVYERDAQAVNARNSMRKIRQNGLAVVCDRIRTVAVCCAFMPSCPPLHTIYFCRKLFRPILFIVFSFSCFHSQATTENEPKYRTMKVYFIWISCTHAMVCTTIVQHFWYFARERARKGWDAK